MTGERVYWVVVEEEERVALRRSVVWWWWSGVRCEDETTESRTAVPGGVGLEEAEE